MDDQLRAGKMAQTRFPVARVPQLITRLLFKYPSAITLPTVAARSKTHSCRVRRKRERLPSNGLIQSNPAISLSPLLAPPSAGLLQIRF